MGGIPGESIAGLMNTFITVLQNGARPRLNLYYPIPNTKLYDQLCENGLIKSEQFHKYRSDLPYIEVNDSDILVDISMITIALKTVWQLVKENIFTNNISLPCLFDYLSSIGYKIVANNDSTYTVTNITGQTEPFPERTDGSFANFNWKIMGSMFSVFSGEYYISDLEVNSNSIMRVSRHMRSDELTFFYKRIYETLRNDSPKIPLAIKLNSDADILYKSIT